MKLAALISAGLIAAAAMLPATASAQMRERHGRIIAHNRVVHTTRGHYRPRARQVCRVVYRNHRRIRTCRTVRR